MLRGIQSWRGMRMKKEQENEKIVLPKELQIKMLNFFMRTSIPRKMQEERDKSSIKKN